MFLFAVEQKSTSLYDDSDVMTLVDFAFSTKQEWDVAAVNVLSLVARTAARKCRRERRKGIRATAVTGLL